MTRGYLEFFEPDVFVEASDGLAKAAGVESFPMGLRTKRVLALQEFVAATDRGKADFAFGVNLFELYRHLYAREFQFASLHERRIAVVKATSPDSALVEAVFGAFPDLEQLTYVERGFFDAFAPEELPATAATWLRVVEERFRTPLDFCAHGIQASFSSYEPVVFVFDPKSTLDLIDLWNLRQFQGNVLAVSVEWLPELRDFLRELIVRNHRPIPGNVHGTLRTTTIEFGRSIAEERADAVSAEAFRDLPDHSWVSKRWYEPLWQPRNDLIFRPRPVAVTANESRLELSPTAGAQLTFRIRTLSPEFCAPYARGAARWVNVLSFDPVQVTDELPLTLPADYPELGKIRVGKRVFASREGLVLPLQHNKSTEFIRMPSGTEAMVTWLKARGLSVKKSDAGQVADRVLGSVNGISGAFILEHKETLELLDKMARSIRIQGNGTVAEYPERTAPVEEWFAVLKRRNTLLRGVVLQDFVDAGAIKLGLWLQCENCRGYNWYGLNELSERLRCHRCLGEFSFPQATLNFRNSPWRYRVVGPFAVPDFAGGAYSTVLSLRVFATKLASREVAATLSTNLLLEFDGVNAEVDFALWFAREDALGRHEAPRLVVGEAKSFAQDAIKPRDVQRMQQLASRVPGTALAFAVLKETLSGPEQELLRKLAVWGRKLMPNGEQRTPVIILTARELFAEDSIAEAWQNSGGKAAALVGHPSVRTDNLSTLADLTQQLYLGLEPWEAWLEKQWKQRRRTRLKSPPN